jgi:large subunit ribosomal protein L20
MGNYLGSSVGCYALRWPFHKIRLPAKPSPCVHYLYRHADKARTVPLVSSTASVRNYAWSHRRSSRICQPSGTKAGFALWQSRAVCCCWNRVLYLTLLTLRFLFLQHKRLLKHAKGYRGRSKNCFTIAIRRVEKAWQYAYRDRKVKKRVWRTLWIQRLSAAARQYNIRYSRLIAGLNYASVPLNRKVLSELAATEPFAFKSVIDVIKYQQAEHDAKKLLSSST